MDWDSYKKSFRIMANRAGKNELYISACLAYAQKLVNNNLPVIYDQNHLAKLIGINSEYLHAMSNSQKKFYRTFYINKKNGRLRRIDEPLPDLKAVQGWILREILYKIPVSKYAKGYIKGTSLKDNARFHKNQRTLINIDMENFFPNIKFGRIFHMFISLEYSRPVAVFLANLCCYRNSLPQGAPTSPYLSNIIASNLDRKISLYTNNLKLRYTRYADDISVSGEMNVQDVIYSVKSFIESEGFKFNKEKIRVSNTGARQIVTGIVVNEKLQAPRNYRDEVRKEMFFIEKYGLENHIEYIGEKRKRYLEHLIGKINYIRFVNPNDKNVDKYMDILTKYL
jgi:RNA-directed DNA polymerase